MSNSTVFSKRRYLPLGGIQFLGVFVDYAFKTIACLAGMKFLNDSPGNQSTFLAFITMIYAMPFVMFPGFCGYLSDRFPKRNILELCKVAEIFFVIIAAVSLSLMESMGIWPLLASVFLLSLQSAVLSPAYNGILPEMFGEKGLSIANGISGMLTSLAVIAGSAAGFILPAIWDGNLIASGWSLIGCSILGTICAMSLEPSEIMNPHKKWKASDLFTPFLEIPSLFKDRPLWLSILGDSFFSGLATAILALVLVYAINDLGIKDTDSLGLGALQLAMGLGIGAGSILAGIWSKDHIELGFVPFGSLGMVFSLLLIVFCPGISYNITIGSSTMTFFPFFVCWLFLLGISGGLFIVPLRAFMQYRIDEKQRGSILANANVVCFSFIIFSACLIFFFTGGIESHTQSLSSGWIESLQRSCLSCKPETLLLILCGLTILCSIYIFTLLPFLAFRFLVISLTRFVYRLRIQGAENIPETGPGLLISNHVSFVDGLLISTCTSRQIRFIVHSDYFRHPLLLPLSKLANFIEMPSSRRETDELFEKIRDLLAEGKLVCVFPEGRLTRSGLMDAFRAGYMKMLPKDVKVPIIPIRLGLIWGSVFSYYYGPIRPRVPVEFPYPASVTIGKPCWDLIPPHELRLKITELGAESEMIPRDEERPLHYQFAKKAMRHPFQTWIRESDGKGIKNWKLMVAAALLSREIREMSTQSQNVGILLPNTLASAISALAVLTADKVPCVLNFTASHEGMIKAIKKAKIKCVLTSKKFIEKINIQPLPEMIFLEDIMPKFSSSKRAIMAIAFWCLPHQELMNWLSPKSHRNVQQTAVILFSSGSSGDPKGVMLTHHNINSNVYALMRIVAWQKDEKIVGNLPLFHSFGFMTGFWLPLMVGSEVVYVANPIDAAAIGKAIEEYKLTILLATPTFLLSYMRKCTPEQFKSLRLVVAGAEKLRAELAVSFRKKFGIVPIEGYGATELSPVVALNIGNSILHIGTKVGHPGSVGIAIPGVCVKIVNPETRQLCQENEEGLVLVKAPSVMKGYFEDPEKTAEVLTDGWYNTGDIGCMNLDGYIKLTGRFSRFSKIGGEMVPHEKVEQALMQISDPEHRTLAVTGVPDASKGERLIVFHTIDFPLTPDEACTKLRELNLPNLWIPKAKDFIMIDAIPLLGSGKLDLGTLKKQSEKISSK